MATRERQIFRVHAEVVDANGALNPLTLDGVTYPRTFDSKIPTFEGNIEKCLNYAKAEWHHVCEHMLKRDDRQMQTCFLMTADGRIIDSFVKGAIEPEEYTPPEPKLEGNGETEEPSGGGE